MRSSRNRREFLRLIAGGTAALAGCTPLGGLDDIGGGSARLSSRPTSPSSPITPGTYQLTANPNDGILFVPSGYRAGTAMPFVLGLHGAGMLPGSQITLLRSSAEERGFLLLAVGSRGVSWDVFSSRYSYDVTFIDSMLKFAFEQCTVDAARVAVEGFSDGASYALGLGLANGDLFSRVIAFSPGFIPRSDSAAVGRPRFFDSHGRQDPILPIDSASRKIVPELKGRGYDVTFTEFDGGHSVPAVVVTQAVDWFLG